MAEEEPSEESGESEDEGDESSSEEKSGGKTKLIIIIAAVVLLLLGGGAAVFFSGLLDSDTPEEATEQSEGEDGEGGEGGEGGKPGGPSKPVFFDLDEMIVNLNTTERRQSLLKISVSLEVANEKDVKTIKELMPRVVDNFQTYLRELRLEDLKGSAGMYRLREELLTRINVAVEPAVVNAVLFKEMLVQ